MGGNEFPAITDYDGGGGGAVTMHANLYFGINICILLVFLYMIYIVLYTNQICVTIEALDRIV